MSELVIILILFVAIIFMYATGLIGGIPKLLKLVEQEDFDTSEFDCKEHKDAYEALLEHEEGDDPKIDLLFEHVYTAYTLKEVQAKLTAVLITQCPTASSTTASSTTAASTTTASTVVDLVVDLVSRRVESNGVTTKNSPVSNGVTTKNSPVSITTAASTTAASTTAASTTAASTTAASTEVATCPTFPNGSCVYDPSFNYPGPSLDQYANYCKGGRDQNYCPQFISMNLCGDECGSNPNP
jgi:hypothetical protein